MSICRPEISEREKYYGATSHGATGEDKKKCCSLSVVQYYTSLPHCLHIGLSPD